MLRKRKGGGGSKLLNENKEKEKEEEEEEEIESKNEGKKKKHRQEEKRKWNCFDNCCWLIGFVCSIWWLLLFLYNAMPASFPQYVTEAITGELGKEEGVAKVKVINKTNVVPNKQLGKKECHLVTFDLPYVTFYYNQKLLLYKGADFEDAVAKLKEGLGVVLEEFYPLAGKLGKDEEGVLRVEYEDENAGVEVAEAVADDVDIAELAKEDASSILQEIIPCTNVMNLEGLHRPLLAVQQCQKAGEELTILRTLYVPGLFH